MKRFFRKHQRTLFMIFHLVVIASFMFKIITDSQNGSEDAIAKVPYTEFLKMADAGKIDTIYYNLNEEEMTFTLFNKDTVTMTAEERSEYKYENADKRITIYPAYEDFRKDMLEKGISLSIIEDDESPIFDIVSILLSFAPTILIIYAFSRLIKNVSGPSPIGDGHTDYFAKSNVKFSDIIGHDEVIEDVKFISELIKNPEIGGELGVKIPKGILLSGSPGTGKTLIAKAIAGEAGVPFLSVCGSDFEEKYVGVGAQRVRNLFKTARQQAPCVVFIDEIDSLGSKRSQNPRSSDDGQTINALLKEMDGFTGREGIFIIAATNRSDKLDPALTRSGRFDREIKVEKPRDWKVRKQLFKFYLSQYKVSDNVDVENLSKQCSGFTGADIETICNEAGIVALQKGKKSIDRDCIEEAIDKKIFKGNRSKEKHFKTDQEIVAYHEAGHAVMSHLLNYPISRASIIGTTSGVGGAVMRTDSDSCFITNKEMCEDVMIAYAGRASEELKFSTITTGASSDITKATHIMLNYIQRYGFDQNFGLLDMQVLNEQSVLENSDITERLTAMSKELYEKTKKLLKENYHKVEILAKALLEKETLSGNEIEQLLSV